jgi:hypothetical protein
MIVSYDRELINSYMLELLKELEQEANINLHMIEQVQDQQETLKHLYKYQAWAKAASLLRKTYNNMLTTPGNIVGKIDDEYFFIIK